MTRQLAQLETQAWQQQQLGQVNGRGSQANLRRLRIAAVLDEADALADGVLAGVGSVEELRIRACHVYGSFIAHDNRPPKFTVQDALDSPVRDVNRIVLPGATIGVLVAITMSVLSARPRRSSSSRVMT